MAIPNEDTLLSAIQLEGQASKDTSNNFLTDALPGNNMLGAVEAVAADIGASFYNLGSLTGAYDSMSEDDLVKHLGDMGLNSAADYYHKHPQATQLIGMVAGGWKLGAMGANSVAKLLGRGEIMATETGDVLAKTLARKQHMEVVAQEAGVASEAYKTALKDYKRSNYTDMGILGAGNVLVSDMVMSQSYALQDTTNTDLALGMAVGGVANMGLTGIARALAANKTATADVASVENEVVSNIHAYIPFDVRGTLGEAATLSGQRKAAAEYLKGIDNPRMQQWGQQMDRVKEARQLELIDAATHADLKVVQGEAAKVGYDFKRDLANHIKDKIGDAPVLAGAKNISPFNPDSHLASFAGASVLEEQALRNGIKDVGKVVMAVKREQSIGWDKTSAGHLAKELGTTMQVVDMLHTTMNTSMIDARTGMLYGLDQARQLATSLDAGINKITKTYNSDHTALAAQIQHNNFDAIHKALIAYPNSMGKGIGSAQELDAKTFTEVLHYKTGLDNGKWSNKAPIQAKEFDAYFDARLKREASAMRSSGMGAMEVSLRLHANPLAIEEMGLKSAGVKLDNVLLNPLNAEGIKPYHALAVIKGDAVLGQSTIERGAAMDAMAVRNLNNDILAQQAAGTTSTLLRDSIAINNSGLGEGVRAQQRNLNPALYSDNVFVSAEMALRHQGDMAKQIVAFGGYMQKKAQDNIKNIVHPGNVILAKIQLDDIERVTWNKTEAALRSTQIGDGEMVTVSGKELVKIDKDGAIHQILDSNQKPLGVLPDNVAAYWQEFEKSVSMETRELINFHRGVNGIGEVANKGIVLPPKNLMDAYIAYAIDEKTGATSLITAATYKGLESLMNEAKIAYPSRTIITEQNDIKRFNQIHDHAAIGIRTVADFNKAKTGAQFEAVSPGNEQMESFISANNQHLMRLNRQAVRQMNTETIGLLRQMHELQGVESTLYSDLEKTAFGGNILARHDKLTAANDMFTGGLNYVLEKLDSIAGPVMSKIWDKGRTAVGKTPNSKADVIQAERVMKEFTDKGLADQLPWHSLNQALAETDAYKQLGNRAQDAVAVNSFLTSTLALRFLELSHPLITTLSIAITTLPEAMMHAGNYAGMKHMMEGVRRAYSPAFSKHMGILEERGIISSQVSETTDFIASNLASPKIATTLEHNKVFRLLTAPSDWSEKNARRVAAATASSLYDAQHGAGQWLSSDGLAFIDIFTKRTMGNYNTNMRPAMFQGTGGAAIGLFQTYVWTMGQLLYRSLETGNKGAFAATMGVQAGVFGLRSLPGYDVTNHYIGSHYGNTDNADITSSIYENVASKSQAEALLYGAPSTLFHTSLWTRGVLDARSPLTVQDDGSLKLSLAGTAPIMAALGMAQNTIERISQGATLSDSFLSAVQLQTLSRPFARAADVAQGNSIDRKFATVDPNTGVNEASGWASFARALGSRPLQEQIDRDLGYQTSFYNTANSHSSQSLMQSLRLNIQGGNPAPLGDALRKYIAMGGSRSGFRAAVNKIYLESEKGTTASLDTTRLKEAMDLLPR